MNELVCISKGIWVAKAGKTAGDIGTGPAFNEIVFAIDQRMVLGRPAYQLRGYEGDRLHQKWFHTKHFAPLISDQELEQELLTIPLHQHAI